MLADNTRTTKIFRVRESNPSLPRTDPPGSEPGSDLKGGHTSRYTNSDCGYAERQIRAHNGGS
ncbi:hypothetical protein PGT21_008427 [Puccinia graminis f. sp. tritici]|uniref:Uncharacterized protein n=1 Tax=Puccinia graminis f. sp. tritici TaxID=56615 RepID=A0A5B0PTK4_PUCGR|nr:hypothetical protein PGT21_008427 [Puccinia graminis f. sp. tritici]KAA1128280.1 hypothetical protein PGTUg99_021123 [Puccinia graminis f. sp. tritici]